MSSHGDPAQPLTPLVSSHIVPDPTNLPQSDVGKLIQKFPLNVSYIQYAIALEPTYLPQIRALIAKDLSEPYSIYVYRYFLYQWPELCFLAIDTSNSDPSTHLLGVVICKQERHRGGPMRGYIAMLATKTSHRGQGIAKTLVSKAIDLMISRDADEIALETEESNTAAMSLYEGLGFLRSKKLHRYYLNGNSAYRLLLYLKPGVALIPTEPMMESDYPTEVEEGGDAQLENYPELPPSAQEELNFANMFRRHS